jgi:hypothetical protein
MRKRYARWRAILDDVAIPMSAVLNGERVVFDRAARAYDCVAGSPATEFTRKVRTLTGNFQLLKQMPQLIVPWRNPVFVQFVSHKVGRLFVPYFLMMLFASNLFLDGAPYRAILTLQCAWYLLAFTGAVLTRREHSEQLAMKTFVLFPYTFVLLNWAAVVGLCHILVRQHDPWSGYQGVDSLPKPDDRHALADRHAPDFSDAA